MSPPKAGWQNSHFNMMLLPKSCVAKSVDGKILEQL